MKELIDYIKKLEEGPTNEKNHYIKDEELTRLIKAVVEKIKDGKINDENVIYGSICNETIKEYVKEMFRDYLTPFRETAFIRKIDHEKLRELIGFLIENVMISINSDDYLIKETGLNKDELSVFIKFANTMNNVIIIKRFSHRSFNELIYKLFRFKIEASDIVWEEFNNRKSDLVQVALMESIDLCRNIDDNFRKFISFIKNE